MKHLLPAYTDTQNMDQFTESALFLHKSNCQDFFTLRLYMFNFSSFNTFDLDFCLVGLRTKIAIFQTQLIFPSKYSNPLFIKLTLQHYVTYQISIVLDYVNIHFTGLQEHYITELRESKIQSILAVLMSSIGYLIGLVGPTKINQFLFSSNQLIQPLYKTV